MRISAKPRFNTIDLHLLIVPYPIGFWTVSFLFDLAFYFDRNQNFLSVSKILVILGTAGGVISALPVLSEWASKRENSPTAIAIWQARLIIAAVIAFGASVFLRTESGAALARHHLQIPFTVSAIGLSFIVASTVLAIKIKARSDDARSSDESCLPRPYGTKYILHLGPASLVLIGSIWFSSGTMAPYGATLRAPRVMPPCDYLVNIDHSGYSGIFEMLNDGDRSLWGWTPFARRILFTVVAFPFMKIWGFELGGFVASLLLHLLSFLAFISFLRKEIGESAAIAGMWLLATYPGISYWAALPYANAAIVPCCLLATILLWKLNAALTETAEIKWVVAHSLLLGLLFTAYDLMPYYGFAAVLIVLANRRYSRLPWVLLGLITPTAISTALLKFVYGMALTNSNTEPYSAIVGSYLHRPDFANWIPLLEDLPRVAIHNYFFSNFLFLPLLFLVLWVINSLTHRLRLTVLELSILIAAIVVFLINNLAPPYLGWQMRGDGLARLYQPAFPAMILFSVRSFQDSRLLEKGWKRFVAGLCLATVLANAVIAFGPILHSPYTSPMYYEFYKHVGLSSPTAMSDNLERYGRRPIGFCNH